MASSVAETRIIEVRVTSTGEASLKALQTQLDAVAKQYDRAAVSTTKMNKAQVEQDKALRGGRTAWVGLGQQLQDATVQLQMGTNALTVFTQQGSQAAYMLQGMGGRVGKVAGFMAGPWGAAIFAATAVLGPFIAGLGEVDDKLGGLNQKEFDRLRRELNATAKELQKVGDLTISWGDYIKAVGQIIDEYMDVSVWEGIGKAVEWVGKVIKVALIFPLQAVASLILGLGKTGKDMWEQGFGGAKNAGKNITDAWKALSRIPEVASSIRDARIGESIERDTKKAKDSTKKVKDEFAELLEIWRKGGPELAKLKDEFEQLSRVYKVLNDGAVWSKDTVDTSKLSQTLGEIYNKIRALESPIEAIRVEFEDFTSETDKLNTRFKLLYDIMTDMTQDPAIRSWAADQAQDIAYKLEPALKSVTDQVDRYYEDLRKATETSNAGGAEKQGLLDRKKGLENQQNSGLLSPEGAKVVAEELRQVNFELARMELSPAQLEGVNLMVETIEKLGDAFAQAIESGESLKKAFKAIAKDVIRELVKIIVKLLIVKALQSAFPGSQLVGNITAGVFPQAKGGVFDHGIKKFADGGVVSAPTMFGMRGGLGVMGEAGPEAVMPLKRGADGKLGVAGAAPQVVINNYAGVGVSTSINSAGALEIELRAVESARKAVASDIRRGGNPVSRAMETTYGVGRGRS